MKKLILTIAILSAIVSCAPKRTIDVKSPCVSTEDGPCGPKHSVNDWWLKNNV